MSTATSLERPFWKTITVQLVAFRRILERLRGPLPSGTSPLLPRFGPDVDRTAWDWVISQFPGYQDAGFVKVTDPDYASILPRIRAEALSQSFCDELYFSVLKATADAGATWGLIRVNSALAKDAQRRANLQGQATGSRV